MIADGSILGTGGSRDQTHYGTFGETAVPGPAASTPAVKKI
jgi:hypothetical protein